MRLASVLLAVVLAAPAAAQPNPLEDPYFPAPAEVAVEAAKLDGTPFELDSNTTLQRLRAFADAVSGSTIHDCIESITTDVPYTYKVMGTPTHALFLEKYANVFGELGLATALQDFAEGGPGTSATATGGTNIVAVLPGKALDKWVVLGGHYDTREETLGGGALDNVSGICTVLEIARQAKSYVDAGGELAASLVFNWYDGEEWGLYGSIAFAEDTSVAAGLLGLPAGVEPDVLVTQSYDMVGLNWPAQNTWVQYGDPMDSEEVAVLNLRTAPIHNDTEWADFSYCEECSYEALKGRHDFDDLLRNFTHYQFLVREVAHDLMGCPPEYCWVYDDDYGRSDHIPLIGHGAPGNRIQGSHDNQYPHYHHATDTLPALYQLAGSQQAFTDGLDAQASIGGTVAFYAALTGSVGHYGYVYDAALLPVTLGDGAEGPGANPVPAPQAALAVLALAGALRLARRRA